MPIGTTSYFFLSMAFSTEAADSSDTSCSPLRPPNNTPTRSFFMHEVYMPGLWTWQKLRSSPNALALGGWMRVLLDDDPVRPLHHRHKYRWITELCAPL